MEPIIIDSMVFSPKVLEHHDLPNMLDLQQLAKKHMASTDTLQPLSRSEFEFILNGNGLIVGLFEGQKLVAFRALLMPFIDGDHLGLDAGLSLGALSRVIYLELSIVHPDYRGKGLQLQMGKIVMGAIDRSRYDYVCSTVAPFNIPSLKDKFVLGLHIVAMSQKYGGKLRYVFMKTFKDEQNDVKSSEERVIPMSDTATQQRLLNEGFIGVSISTVTDEWHVQYLKILTYQNEWSSLM